VPKCQSIGASKCQIPLQSVCYMNTESIIGLGDEWIFPTRGENPVMDSHGCYVDLNQ
jgi:hypothetical protein